jgi:hypothetical protein
MKQNLNYMKTTYHITPEIYEELGNRCDGTFTWDCIELADGYIIIFASKFCKPCNVDVRDEEDNSVSHDFNMQDFWKYADR